MSFGYISEVISTVAIVVSVIFLAVQIYQNTKVQKALVVDSLAKSIADINAPLTADPAIGISISKALLNWNTSTAEDKARAHYFLFSFFKLTESAWFQREAGILSESQWKGWEAMGLYYFRSQAVQDHWWRMRGGAFSAKFHNDLVNNPRKIEIYSLDEIIQMESERC